MDGDAATQRYKSLEDAIQRLEISQRKREQERGKKRMQTKKKDLVSGRQTLPAIRPKSQPASSPSSRSGRNPTAEVNRRRDIEAKFEARMQELLDEKMRLNKKFSAATSTEYRLQKRIRDTKSTLAVLKDQDNIHQRRHEMRERCSEEQQLLADTNMQIAIASNYTKTLDLMKDRLWLNQCTFQKTMDAYYKTLDAQKAEVADVTKMRENASLKLAKAHERNKKFKTKAAEHLQFLQRQVDGLRYMVDQNTQLEEQKKASEKARLEEQARKAHESRAKGLTSQMREANDRHKQNQLMDQMHDHEDAFRKIQMASGLETDDEIIDAFNNREAYLSDVVRKVDMLRRQLNEAQKRHNQMKAAMVNELVEQDSSSSSSTGNSGGSSSGSTSLAMNIWGGTKGNEVDLSTELLQQQRTRLQRTLREQAKMRENIIKFAQAVEGVFGSIAELRNTPSLAFEAFLAPIGADAGAAEGADSSSSKGSRRVASRPNSRSGRTTHSRPGSSRANYGTQRSRSSSRATTPRRKAQERERAAAAAATSPSNQPGSSILTADHLNMRMNTIEKVAVQLADQILSLKALHSSDSATGAETDAEAEQKSTAPSSSDKAMVALGAEYEDKVADFMWAQKFAVRNNVRVKALSNAPPTPDDRQSFFSQESHAQHSRAQMLSGHDGGGELLDMEDDDEMLFNRDNIKKVSLTLINKNTRRQKQRSKKKGSSDDRGQSKRNDSPSPRRAGTIRQAAPGDN